MNKYYTIGFAVSIVAVLILVRMLDFNRLMEAFAKVSLIGLIPCVAMYLLMHFVRVIRWRLMLRPLAHTSFESPLSALSICLLANNILPAHMGEFVRAYLVATENQISKSAVFATVVTERVYDGLSVLFFLLLLLLLLDLPETAAAKDFALSRETLRNLGLLGFAFFGGLLVTLRFLYYQESRAIKVFSCLMKPLPDKFSARVIQFCVNFVSGLKVAGMKDLAATILLSLLLWLLQCLWFCSPALAFGLDIPISAGFLMTVVSTFAMLIPSAPAFVGTFQIAAIVSLGYFGVDPNEAGAFSIVLWVVYLLTSSLLGLFFVWRTGLNWRDLKHGELM